jgi:hypothetical protein
LRAAAVCSLPRLVSRIGRSGTVGTSVNSCTSWEDAMAGRTILTLAAALALVAPAAQAAHAPPGAVMSDSLRYVGRIADTGTVIEGKFDRVRGRDLLVVDGSWGLKTIDVSNPRRPKELGTFLPPGVQAGGFWEGEDLDIDPARKLAFMSMDPRHVDVDQASCPGLGHESAKTRNPNCRSGVVVVSYADPARLRQVGDFIDVPAGHTTSCIERCRFLWTNGPARREDQFAIFGVPQILGGLGDGRPVWVTDMRDPRRPHVFPDPIDLHRNDGVTDYTHDIQVDAAGIAWASGRGGIRGYATRGRFRDPATDRRREATPWSPILVAGGGVAGVSTPGPEGRFMHNSMRPLNGLVHARGVRDGNILVGTEEQFNGACADDGRLVFSDITASLGGEPSQNSTAEHPFRMRAIATWHPALDTPETTAPNTDCSAHYFDIQGATLTQAWYSQGTRVLDISNAARPRQIAFFRVQADGSADNPSSVVWDTTFHRGLLWVFDNSRGVEVLRLRGSTSRPGRLRSVVAPDALPDGFVARPVRDFATSYVCPLFRAPAAAVAAGVVTGT